MTAPPAARREVEEPLELAADRGDVGLERLAVEQVPLATTGPTGRRSSRSRRRRAPPAARRGAGAGAARRSGPGGRRGATAGRVEADVAGDRPAGGQAGRQARRRRVQHAPPLELGEESAEARAGVASARRRHRLARRAVSTREAQRPVIHDPYAIVRPDMQTSLARRQRHRRALQRRPAGTRRIDLRSDRHRHPVILLLAGLARRGRGAVLAVGAYNYYAAGLPDPKDALNDLDFDQQTIVYDRTGKIELARLGELQARGRDVRPAARRDHRRDDRDRGQGLLDNPGFDPSASSRPASTPLVGPAARRLDDHPAARSGAPAPAEAFDGSRYERKIREIIQSLRLTAGLPGRRGQAADHHRLPEPELLRQPELRREGRGQELLRQGAQGPDPGPGGDPRGDPPVADQYDLVRNAERGLPRGRSPRARTAPSSSSSCRPTREIVQRRTTSST